MAIILNSKLMYKKTLPAKAQTYYRKISDSATVSGGGGSGSSSPGVKPYVSRGSSNFNPANSEADVQAQKAAEARAHNQSAYRESQIQAQQSQLESENKQRAMRESQQNYGSTSTGNYERGGYVVQETRGKYEDLVRLGKQQPGSRVVQNEGGEYLLIRSTGTNLLNETNLNELNKNIGLEGGSKYTPTEKKNAEGGTDYHRKLVDTVGIKSETGGNILSEKPSDEIGYLYTVKLHDELGPAQKQPYQKTRAYQPREIAEEISAGKRPNQFIGIEGADIRGYEQASAEQQKFTEKEVLPITYTNEKGQPIVTITGKSEGAEYQILGKKEPVDLSNLQGGTKPEANKIFPFPLEANPQEINPIQVAGAAAKQEYINTGIDTVVTMPILGFGVVKNPISTELNKYRQDTDIDRLFRGQIPKDVLAPSFVGSAIAFGSTAIIPTKVPRIPKFAFQSMRSKVTQLETEFLREPGIISGSEKLGKETYLISKGTENKPALVPLTVVKKSPTGELTAYEITPEPRILYPKEINIQGSLFEPFKTELETKQIGKYSFKSENPSLEAKQTFRMGVETEGIKPIAEVRHAPVKSILEGKSSELYEYSKSTKGIYAQTRAETKFNPPKNPLVPSQTNSQKGLKNFDLDLSEISPKVGAGQAGRGFSPQQTKAIKTFVKAEAKQAEKPRQDFLGIIHPPQYFQAQAAESILLQYPEGSPKHLTRLKERTTQKENQLISQKLSVRQETKSLIGQETKLQTKTAQKTQLKNKLRMELIPRLEILPRQQVRTRPAQISKQIQRQTQKEKLIQVPDIPLIPKEKIKTPKPLFFLLTPNPKKRKENKESKKGSRLNFFGNVPQESVIGIFGKKQEITYSEKKSGFSLRDLNPKRRKKSKKKTGFEAFF